MENLFIDTGDKSIGSIVSNANTYDDNTPIFKTAGSVGTAMNGWDHNTTIKSSYSRDDYNFYREKEAFPTNRKQIIKYAQRVYDRVGIVRNVIDLMADFGVKGIRLSHPIPAVQRFYQNWFNKVSGVERSERFLNCLYRLGVVAVYRNYANITQETERDYKSVGQRNIPIKYSFINPGTLDIFGENISSFVTKNIYILNLPTYIHEYVQGYAGADREKILRTITDGLPSNVREAILKRQPHIILDQDRLSVYHYKKDDWHTWGKPVTFPIMDDLVALEKLKLADISALDGAISNVRLWRIGRLTDNPNTTLLPTKAMLDKVRKQIENNVGGGTLDMVWGPELDFKESDSKVHQFLGPEKYKPTLDAIYDGLGIPLILRGDADHRGGANFISLKTLIERLNYGRNLLIDFWNQEIKNVQKTMGFAKPAIIEFENMVLIDEAAEKQLLINLADRDIISHDTLREKFGINVNIEESRIKREVKKRGDRMPEKASPFHNPEKAHDYKKMLLSGGVVTPSEIGLELEERKPGESSRFEQQLQHAANKRLQSNDVGRPPNIVETQKRASRTGDNMRVARSVLEWGYKAQAQINESIDKVVSSIDNITEEQKRYFDMMKAHTLFNISPLTEITNEVLYTAFSAYKSKEFGGEVDQILSLDTSLEDRNNRLLMLYVLNNSVF